MENVIVAKYTVLGVLSTIGAGLLYVLGGWDMPLTVLVGFMAADYITGMIVAGVFNKSNKSENGALESWAGFKGIVKKVGVLFCVGISFGADLVARTSFVRDVVVLFFIGNEGLSVLENLALMGVRLPKVLKKALEVLKEKGEDE